MTNPSVNPFQTTNPPRSGATFIGGRRHAAANAATRRHTVITQGGVEVSFIGEVIGAATTEQALHSHGPERFAEQRERCFACRWFESCIYRVEDVDAVNRKKIGWLLDESPKFIVVTVGGSAVPHERYFHNATATSSGFDVVELLTIRKEGRDPYLSQAAARTLGQAAGRDEDIREAYINRAVV